MIVVLIALWLANLVPGAQSPLPVPWENPAPTWPHLVAETQVHDAVQALGTAECEG